MTPSNPHEFTAAARGVPRCPRRYSTSFAPGRALRRPPARTSRRRGRATRWSTDEPTCRAESSPSAPPHARRDRRLDPDPVTQFADTARRFGIGAHWWTVLRLHGGGRDRRAQWESLAGTSTGRRWRCGEMCLRTPPVALRRRRAAPVHGHWERRSESHSGRPRDLRRAAIPPGRDPLVRTGSASWPTRDRPGCPAIDRSPAATGWPCWPHTTCCRACGGARGGAAG